MLTTPFYFFLVYPLVSLYKLYITSNLRNCEHSKEHNLRDTIEWKLRKMTMTIDYSYYLHVAMV